jgi:oligopeptide transport system permease protein
LTTARIVRGQVLSLRHREFVEAAILGGASTTRILLRHLLPNCLGPIVVYTALTVPLVILQESFLAFIGLQATWGDGTLDSWGTLVNQGMDQLDPSSGARWWLLAVPASAMTITLLALNVLGDAIRDALDPRSRP